jgi:hypothetical protein
MFHSSGARVEVDLAKDGYVLMHIKDSEGLVTSADISDIAALCAHIGATHGTRTTRDGSSSMTLEASASVGFTQDGRCITLSEGLALVKSGLYHATARKNAL